MLSDLINRLQSRRHLTVSEMEAAFEIVLNPSSSAEEVSSFLIALRDKGETAEEVEGAVRALDKQVRPIYCHTQDLLDTCGTGGDQKNTFNISTATAFVVAGAGVAVAKHGNRAVSSRSGSADVLKALGINIEAAPDLVSTCIEKIGIGFLFAPLYYPILKSVAPIRKKIGTKTIFNLLGPLLNPLHAQRQVVGVYHPDLLPIVAEVLKKRGLISAAVVHGCDGMDEVTLAGKTQICFLKKGQMSSEIFDPRSVGYDYCDAADLAGGSAEDNAKRLRQTLKGHSQPIDHCVHLNAALALRVSGKADDWKQAVLMAQQSVSSGAAYQKLEALIEMTNRV